jgi:hypothetical protein
VVLFHEGWSISKKCQNAQVQNTASWEQDLNVVEEK